MAEGPTVPLHLRSDEDLGAALRKMTGEIAWPAAEPVAGGPDIAALVRARIVPEGAAPAVDGAPRGEPRRSSRPRWTPVRRALVFAIVALLALAAVAGAAGLGLPGLRIIFGGPSAAPSPSASAGPSVAGGASRTPPPLGSRMGLGEQVSLGVLGERAQFPVRIPADPTIGPPVSAWVDPARNGQVALVWPSSDRLPPTEEPGVGLVLTAFRGAVDDGWFTKVLGAGTTAERVRVGGQPGYWVSGDPHFFFYEGPNGPVEESRRWVGDVLLWADGPITYRLETSLGRDAAIAIAETLQ